MLYKRYSNPLMLLQQMLDSRQCPEFIDKVIQWNNEEKEENWLWEVWLHKVFDKEFNEFVSQCKKEPADLGKETEKSNIEATVNRSVELLNDFSGSFILEGGN